jgi:Uncharacterized protein conserved in bacteria
MRILKTPWFSRFAEKESLVDESLIVVVDQLEAGLFDADLGSGVYKQRLARPGQGKSGGYRVLVCFRQGMRCFFVYGFPKSSRGNMTVGEKNDLKKLAKILFAMTDEQLDASVKAGAFQEITSEE